MESRWGSQRADSRLFQFLGKFLAHHLSLKQTKITEFFFWGGVLFWICFPLLLLLIFFFLSHLVHWLRNVPLQSSTREGHGPSLPKKVGLRWQGQTCDTDRKARWATAQGDAGSLERACGIWSRYAFSKTTGSKCTQCSQLDPQLPNGENKNQTLLQLITQTVSNHHTLFLWRLA